MSHGCLRRPRQHTPSTPTITISPCIRMGQMRIWPDNRSRNSRRPGTKFRDCEVCPAMVVIPSGSFMMGSDGGEPDEAPRHRVTITEAFAVGKYEVTVEEFEAFVRNTGHDMG